jgi:hypothetical protein
MVVDGAYVGKIDPVKDDEIKAQVAAYNILIQKLHCWDTLTLFRHM